MRINSILDYNVKLFVGAKRNDENGSIFWNTLSQNQVEFNTSGRKVWNDRDIGQSCIFLVSSNEIWEERLYAYRDFLCSPVAYSYICERRKSKCFNLFLLQYNNT